MKGEMNLSDLWGGCIWSSSKPKTNADRIRAMSDEELAVWFCTDRECDTQHCPFCKMDGCHIEDWLKSPVEVENVLF